MTAIPGSIFAIVMAAASAYGVPVELVAAIIQVESGWDPDALGDMDGTSVPHSFGLMQLHDKGAGAGFTAEQLLDPNLNVEIGTRYLKACLEAFGGSLTDAVSAYNGGIERTKDEGTAYNSAYVFKVVEWYETFQEHGLKPEGPVPTPPLMGCRNTVRLAITTILLKTAQIVYPRARIEEMLRESQDRDTHGETDLQGTRQYPSDLRGPVRDRKGVQGRGRA